MSTNDGRPLFSAVAYSARQLYLLLRCISHTASVQVRITLDGIRFSASETGVVECMYLFVPTSYSLNSPQVAIYLLIYTSLVVPTPLT